MRTAQLGDTTLLLPAVLERDDSRIAVFYNVFTSSQDKLEYVKSIVKEQMDMALPRHQFFVRSIGHSFEINNTSTIRHDETGNEIETLELVWEHCNEHPQDTIVYLHSKGSFHSWEGNDKLRRFLTRGALSEECANLPDTCNVCASRMSPLPHPHTPGNMWLAKCEYVRRLIRPSNFEMTMLAHKEKIHKKPNRCAACIGLKRFAAEHWIYSHPSVMPCDLSNDEKFIWSYHNVPNVDFEIDLKPAPRFELEAYGEGCVWGQYIDYRLLEYRDLFGEDIEIPLGWFGWNLLKKDNSTMIEFGRSNEICQFIN